MFHSVVQCFMVLWHSAHVQVNTPIRLHCFTTRLKLSYSIVIKSDGELLTVLCNHCYAHIIITIYMYHITQGVQALYGQ